MSLKIKHQCPLPDIAFNRDKKRYFSSLITKQRVPISKVIFDNCKERAMLRFPSLEHCATVSSTDGSSGKLQLLLITGVKNSHGF